MNVDVRAALPLLLPEAIAWAEQRSTEILMNGFLLDLRGLAIARRVGVTQPEHVRILMAPKLPQPSDPQLQQAAVAMGLLGP